MKTFFASLLGTIVGILVSVFLIFILLVASISTAYTALKLKNEKPEKIENNSVLLLKLDKIINERTQKNAFSSFNFDDDPAIGLNDILSNIKTAKTDSAIKGIFLEINLPPTGTASIEEIRNALLNFKLSGKFIYSYNDSYSQMSYYLSSVADKIFLNPQGTIQLKGLSAEILFYKNALDKLGISMQIFRHGKFKSAVEPLDLDKMSAANRQQTKTYLYSIWNHIVNGIATSRNITPQSINNIADSLLAQSADDALKYKLVDKLCYKDEALAILKKEISVSQNDDVSFVQLNEYTKSARAKQLLEKNNFSSNKIAIVYAVGEIKSGTGNDQTIGSSTLVNAIRKADEDASVKAIVLRVNSPGGSAQASDIIWHEIVKAKRDKPIIVSMGDVAASGGYYISCAADTIVAEPTTITGSIGVFGMIPNVQKLMNDKLGVTVDTVNTNKHSDFGSIYRPMTTIEAASVQRGIENVYNTFLDRVSNGRHISVPQVDSIGQGRVWSGTDAQKKGLVDVLGNLKDAIAIAANAAKIKSYSIVAYPTQEDAWKTLFNKYGNSISTHILQSQLGEQYNVYNHLKNILHTTGIQAEMPYQITIY
ncbi:MAG TPA: signal peptide peptidase SppA [Bacteroidia bacterium]|nr:signal peptide peptidase SppA [Bacteroidia bacterium]